MTVKKQMITAGVWGLAAMLVVNALGYGFWVRQIAMMIAVGVALYATEKKVRSSAAEKQ